MNAFYSFFPLVLRSHIKEKPAQKFWAIEFNNYLKDGQSKIFVALGGAQFSIYECPEMGNIKLLMRFVDPDVSVIFRVFFGHFYALTLLLFYFAFFSVVT